MILRIIGWVLLGSLALVLLVLLAPASASIKIQNGQIGLKVRVLFLQKTILPQNPDKKQKPKKEKKKKAKKKPKKEKKQEKDKKEKKKKTPQDKISLIKRLTTSGMAAAKPVLHNMRIVNTQLVLPVHAGDAAATALRCGQVHAALGTLRSLLNGRLKVRFKRMELIPDFTGQRHDEFFFACKVVINPGIMIVAGFKFLKTFVALGKKRRTYSRSQLKKMAAKKAAAQKQATNSK